VVPLRNINLPLGISGTLGPSFYVKNFVELVKLNESGQLAVRISEN